MEKRSLLGAFSEAREERVREEKENARRMAEAEARRQQLAPQREAELAEKVRVNSEQAAQFIEIMHAHKVPTIGYYDTNRRIVREAGWNRYRDNSPRGYHDEPHFAEYVDEPVDAPAFLGWVAIKSVVNQNYEDYARDEVLPGVFVSEQGETYPCSKVYRHGDLEYVTKGFYDPGGYLGRGSFSPFAEPDLTLLADDKAIDRVIQNLKEQGLV